MFEQHHSSLLIFYKCVVWKSLLVQLNKWIVVVLAKNIQQIPVAILWKSNCLKPSTEKEQHVKAVYQQSVV